MVYLIRARDGASKLCLHRDSRESAETTAIVLRERGYSDVEIEARQIPQGRLNYRSSDFQAEAS